jgi:hypothetical protein
MHAVPKIVVFALLTLEACTSGPQSPSTTPHGSAPAATSIYDLEVKASK